ncbi:MAG TPA: DHH family phosphoesterase [Candidatus Woesebacteria bacterium]|nr:DHH family phosphoesterase [Candidatus Woesebacteria bacterium]
MLRYPPVEYHDISTNFASDFFALVDKSEHIVLSGHEFADDDSVSSILALFSLLIKRYPQKDIRMICLGDKDSRYSIFRYYDKIEYCEEIADHLKHVDLLVVVDGGNYSRFSHKPEILKTIPHTICIDHHASKIDSFTLSLVISKSPACSQIVFQTFFPDQKIDQELAKTFLLGILGDTGNLSYINPEQVETFSIVKKLVDISQVNILEFQSSYRHISRKIFSAIKEYIKNTKLVNQESKWPPFQYSFVSRNFVTKHRYTDNEISEACFLYVYHYLRTISGYPWGFVITPRLSGDATISCRSLLNSVNVKKFLEEMGVGGGHDQAAGGKFVHQDKSLDSSDCLKYIFSWMQNHNPSQT